MPRAFKSKGNLIGQKIRERRIEVGLSQEELGERLGVSYQQVQKYERGASRLTIERLQNVACSLSVPIDYFLKEMTIARESPAPYNALSAEERRLIKRFRAIPNQSVRLAFLRLLRAVTHPNERKSPNL